jgi:serine kinase of HPr protein (carbohydrate metabolism regulator)
MPGADFQSVEESTVIKAGVVTDPWKEEFFDRHFAEAGIVYEKTPGATLTNYTIETDNLNQLATVIKAANEEAKRSRQ